jgi:hypothetical protein
VARTNLVYNLVYAGIAPDGNLQNATGTRLNTIQFEQYATDAACLTDKVSDMLLGGPLPAAARTAVMTAVHGDRAVGDADGAAEDGPAPHGGLPRRVVEPLPDPALTMTTNRRQFLKRTSALTGAAMAGTFGRLGIESASAQTVTDYKALVCLFKFGGATATT